MKLTKVVFGVLATCMALNAGFATAATTDPFKDTRLNGWSEKACNKAKNADQYVAHCSSYIPKQGAISNGSHAGQSWGWAFPDATIKDANESTDGAEDGTVRMQIVKHGSTVTKFKWMHRDDGKWKPVRFTKEIKDKDIVAHVKKYKIDVDTAMGESAKAAYKEMKKHPNVPLRKGWCTLPTGVMVLQGFTIVSTYLGLNPIGTALTSADMAICANEAG